MVFMLVLSLLFSYFHSVHRLKYVCHNCICLMLYFTQTCSQLLSVTGAFYSLGDLFQGRNNLQTILASVCIALFVCMQGCH